MKQVAFFLNFSSQRQQRLLTGTKPHLGWNGTFCTYRAAGAFGPEMIAGIHWLFGVNGKKADLCPDKACY